MSDRIKKAVKEITPPIVLRALKLLRSRRRPASRSSDEPSGEKGPDWYDAAFESSAEWRRHYTRSRYYFLWTVIADRIVRRNACSIFDVGCGSGQLAALLKARGVERYCGIDFSPKRIAQARKTCPGFEFIEADAFQTELFETLDYDLVLSTEFLEHVEEDIRIIQRVRSGAAFLGTVPNFPSTSHVRHFNGSDEVAARYCAYFDGFRVDDYLADDKGRVFFLLEGIKN